MRNKFISIAMTTYNGEKFLREQLHSIYNQTYKNFEVVVCDDCSSDNTVLILDEYSRKYGLKYFVNSKNLGRNRNFEKVLGLCKGDYIAMSDQDDIWLPEKLETLLAEIDNSSLIHSDACVIDHNTNLIAPSHKRYFNILKFALSSDKYAGEVVSCVWGCTTLATRELIQYSLPIPGGFSHDLWISAVAKRLKGVKYIDKQLILWRSHGENISLQNNNRWRKCLIFLFGDLHRAVRALEIEHLLHKRLKHENTVSS